MNARNEQPGPAEQAFALLLPEMQALCRRELLRVNVDVARVTALLLGVAPGILALREQLVATFQSFNVQRFERLEAYALCLQHTQAMYLAASSRCSAELIREGLSLRTRLASAALGLAQSGVVDGSPLGGLRRTQGYLNLSADLDILVHVLSLAPAVKHGERGVLSTEVSNAADLARVFRQASERHEPNARAVAVAKDWRKRAYTNLRHYYKWLRLAVHYARLDQRDGEKLAPSLFSFRGRRGGAGELSDDIAE